jgi:hypothetical protein
MSAFPLKSTATQNEVDAHETDRRNAPGSMLVGAPHDVPLKATARPSPSTAIQNDADGHDTEVSLCSPSIVVGALQALPL